MLLVNDVYRRETLMKIVIHEDRAAMGGAAAAEAATALKAACDRKGSATLVVATGSSQFEVLAALGTTAGIPWDGITIYHLDEYVGLSPDHPASFRRYLRERFVDRLPIRPKAFHEVGVEADPVAECRRLAALVPPDDFDVSMIGIGENAHVAFNDPPADFETMSPYLVVSLDEPCRRQQVGEGWFPSLESVPTQALSMSIRRILASRTIVCSVPDRRKAEAVRAAVEGPLTPTVPASILRTPANCSLHLDREAASLLSDRSSGPAASA
jgi:glucosamine-6-phosphate deaminase